MGIDPQVQNYVYFVLPKVSSYHLTYHLSIMGKGLDDMAKSGPVIAIAKGLGGAIVNPVDTEMMVCITPPDPLAGSDNYRVNFLKPYR